jgi:hypothetical protein
MPLACILKGNSVKYGNCPRNCKLHKASGKTTATVPISSGWEGLPGRSKSGDLPSETNFRAFG